MRDAAFGDRITFSKKVFIPLTHLCRDTCGYCTFVHPPRRGEAAYLTPEQVLEIARAGQAAGCAEALFTLGDKPELKWKPAAEALAAMGYATTLDYLAAMGALVFKETGLLPHFNPGLMDAADLASCASRRSRWASCSKARPSGWASAAAPTTARPTRCRRCGSPRSRRRARRRCPSPRAS